MIIKSYFPRISAEVVERVNDGINAAERGEGVSDRPAGHDVTRRVSAAPNIGRCLMVAAATFLVVVVMVYKFTGPA